MPPSDRGRFSAKRKRKAVLRLLRGEELDMVSREVGVTGATLSKWREAFLEGGLGALRSRPDDGQSKRIKELERKLGQVVMENELLYGKIDRMEAGLPLARRRSKLTPRPRAACVDGVGRSLQRTEWLAGSARPHGQGRTL